MTLATALSSPLEDAEIVESTPPDRWIWERPPARMQYGPSFRVLFEGSAGGQAAPLTLTRALRDQWILEMRKQGLTQAVIAALFGLTRERVGQILRRELRRVRAETLESAAELRQLELERLDGLLLGLARGIEAGDAKAISAAVRVESLRCRLLGILDPARNLDGQISMDEDSPF